MMRQDVSAAISAGGTGLLNLRRGGAGVIHPRAPAAVDESDAQAVLPTRSRMTCSSHARAGDRDAFASGDALSRPRHSITRAFVREPDDALDLVQETFVKAFQGCRASAAVRVSTLALSDRRQQLQGFPAPTRGAPSISLEEELLQDAGSEPASHHPHADPAGNSRARAVRRGSGRRGDATREAAPRHRHHDIEGFPSGRWPGS